MRVTNQMMANKVTAQLFRQMAQMVKTQEQIISGKRINRPSDDPAGISSVLSYRSAISGIDQYGEAISRMQLHVNTVDDVLSLATDLLEEAKDIAYDTAPTMRTELANEIATIREQVLQIANYQIDGQYLFSGDRTDTLPYTSPDWDYAGDNGTKDAMIGENMTTSIAADGSQIFGPDDDNIFDILDDLEQGLNADDPVQITAQIDRLDSAIDRITTVRARNASTYQRLEATQNHYDYFKVNLEEMLGSMENADPAEAIISFQVQQTNYESALATSSMILQKSLIDFM